MVQLFNMARNFKAYAVGSLCLFYGFLGVHCNPTPIVMWHGMGDSCCNPFSLGRFAMMLQEHIPGVYVRSMKIGNSVVEDTENGFLLDANTQIEMACKILQGDPNLQNGYNALGFSQGGQFLRAVAQRCPSPPMKSLISLGGQHQGVYGVPRCLYPSYTWCDYLRRALNVAAYASWVQRSLVQAQYWHDPLNEPLYRSASLFLADINNERDINETYIENLLRLENLVLVLFNNDTVVQPKGTEWFSFYAPGQAEIVIPMEETNLFLENRLGLKTLQESGRLHLLATDGEHLQFSEEWFIENIIKPFLIDQLYH